ncbi:MAG TPA: polyhydroxyalkanoate depolymerase, partial [Candidatus Paceibacterota bacterium]|nr:polyhydroxyalkanoate depolymerase [Candidatus Paceibacterota bacterium]
AIPWMDGYTRTPLPDKIVWLQDDVTHPQLYWLEVPIEDAKAGEEIVAHRSGQTVQLEGPNARKVTVLLNDLMLDLDQPVTIRAGGRTLFHGRAARTVATLERTLAARGDTNLAFSAEVTVTLP